jgi:hypothetical protein
MTKQNLQLYQERAKMKILKENVQIKEEQIEKCNQK